MMYMVSLYIMYHVYLAACMIYIISMCIRYITYLVFGSLSGPFLAMSCSQHDTFAFRHEPFVEEGETKIYWERYSGTGALLSCVLQTHLSIPTELPPVKGSAHPSSHERQYWYRPLLHPHSTSPLLPFLGVRRGRAAAALLFLFTQGSTGMCS